jgi:ribonuclease Y
MGGMQVPYILYLVITILMLAIGFFLGYLLENYIYKTKIGSIDEYTKKKKEEADKEIEAKKREMRIQMKEELERRQSELESKIKSEQKQIQEIENRLLHKEEAAERKSAAAERKEKELLKREEELDSLRREVEERLKEIEMEYNRVANLSPEEARKIVLDNIQKELQYEYSKKLSDMEKELEYNLNEKAKVLLSEAMERCSTDYVSETTVSVVPLPSEELKGRIIGREGRNIRTFETLTGVDILVDDTPEAVTLSCFDPIRREVARHALEHLIIDGRIHPARIEDFVQEAEKEVEGMILKEAENALLEVSVYNVPNEIKKLIGKMKFRTSYGQNLLRHSIEAATIAGILASELGENVTLAKRAGLLHDIGKVMASEIEGPHALIGADLLKRYGENPLVVHAVAAHHNEVKPETVLDVIIQISDTLSATRPGARRENLEMYIKRLEEIERIAMSVPGIKKAFVVQAGREVRIMVNPTEINEDLAAKISHDVAKKIEEEVVYPGIIRVTVVRETRYTDYAK